jgi:hypothetical protein
VVQKYSHQIDIVVVVGIVAVMIWFVRKRLRERASA